MIPGNGMVGKSEGGEGNCAGTINPPDGNLGKSRLKEIQWCLHYQGLPIIVNAAQ